MSRPVARNLNAMYRIKESNQTGSSPRAFDRTSLLCVGPHLPAALNGPSSSIVFFHQQTDAATENAPSFLYLKKRRMKQGKDRWAPDITNGQFPKKSIPSEFLFFYQRPPSSGRVPVAVEETDESQRGCGDCTEGP